MLARVCDCHAANMGCDCQGGVRRPPGRMKSWPRAICGPRWHTARCIPVPRPRPGLHPSCRASYPPHIQTGKASLRTHHSASCAYVLSRGCGCVPRDPACSKLLSTGAGASPEIPRAARQLAVTAAGAGCVRAVVRQAGVRKCRGTVLAILFPQLANVRAGSPTLLGFIMCSQALAVSSSSSCGRFTTHSCLPLPIFWRSCQGCQPGHEFFQCADTCSATNVQAQSPFLGDFSNYHIAHHNLLLQR